MPVWALLVVYALAVARITGLIAQDDLTAPLRRGLLARLPARPRLEHWVDDLISCPWCVSIWIAAPAAPLMWWYGSRPWVALPAIALAFSQTTGMLSRLGRG
jgi:hypothetical protein